MKHEFRDLICNWVQGLVRNFSQKGQRLAVFFITMVIANQVFAVSDGFNAEVIFIETFYGNNNNPAGLNAISLEVDLAAEQSLKDYRVGETGSVGGSQNSFTVTSTNFKWQSEAIAGDWWFDLGDLNSQYVAHSYRAFPIDCHISAKH